jgi:hypothetical protein
MADAAIISENGRTLLGAPIWRPRQGNRVRLKRKLPARDAIMPSGPRLELGGREWPVMAEGVITLNGDAFNAVMPNGQGYILYAVIRGSAAMVLSNSQATVMTIEDDDGLDAMRYRAAEQRVVAALASQLLLEGWRLAKIKDKEPIFLAPGEALRDRALEDARVLLDEAKEGGCWDYLAANTSADYGVIDSWLVPLGDQKHMRHRLRYFRWFVQSALGGGKAAGRKGGRLPRALSVPSWGPVDHLAQLANDYWYALPPDQRPGGADSTIQRDVKIPGMPPLRGGLINP